MPDPIVSAADPREERVAEAAELLSRHRIGAFNHAQSACDGCGQWMTHEEYRQHLAEKLAELPGATPLYAVLHENDIGRGPEYGVASSVHVDRDRAENALGYCFGMQEAGRPGSEGRYFLAEIREVPDGGE